MVLHRALADAEIGGDVLAGVARENQFHDQAFPRGQSCDVLGREVPPGIQHADHRGLFTQQLAVTDNGCGMDAETQAHIFEPFFTTKEKGKGTGLGLATVYGIVKQSGGYVWVYSEPGRGTSFKVYLPRVWDEQSSPGRDRRVDGQALPQGTETVLLVEDEKGVRELAREYLEMTGYTVIEAENGHTALELAGLHSGPIHLLMTDVVMPGISGRELSERVRAIRPGIRVLFMSGYTDQAVVHHGILETDAVLLQKPFTVAALAAKLRDILNLEVAR